MKNRKRNNSIGAQMAIALQLMKRKNQQALVAVDCKITIEQLAILQVLTNEGDINMTELALHTWKQNANITRMVDKLEKAGMVERKPIEGDRRAHLIAITTKGENTTKNALPAVFAVYDDITSSLTKEEEAITLQTLKKIINYLS